MVSLNIKSDKPVLLKNKMILCFLTRISFCIQQDFANFGDNFVTV